MRNMARVKPILCNLANLRATLLLSGGPLSWPGAYVALGVALPWQRRASARLGAGEWALPWARWQHVGLGP